MISNNFNVSSTNWWSNAAARNPGIRAWSPSIAGQNNIFGQNQAGTSQAFRNSVVQLTETSRALAQALNNIRGIGTSNPPMQAVRPNSENTEALSISGFDPNRLRNSGAQDFNVEILQVAKAQRHEGTALNSTARAAQSGFTTGSHQLAITVGTRQFDININVSSTATNRDVQQQIANAINARNDIGVRATVNNDSTAGTSSLILESAQTGVNNGGQPNFSIRSVTGNATDITGIEAITQQAQDAQFRVNRGTTTGALQTSRTNDVQLGFGITGQLREPGNVGVEMGRDIITQQNAFRHMVNTFNDLTRAARDVGNGSMLQNELRGIARNFSSQLDRIGISLNSEGQMRIDEARMSQAAQSGELERFAARDGFNFMSRITRTAENTARNPAAFAQEADATNAWNMGNAPNLSGAGINFSPMQTVSMTRLMNIGMLFDSLI